MTDVYYANLSKYLEGWIFAKANPELVAKIKEDGNGEPVNPADPKDR
jgi:hypothetical protein